MPSNFNREWYVQYTVTPHMCGKCGKPIPVGTAATKAVIRDNASDKPFKHAYFCPACHTYKGKGADEIYANAPRAAATVPTHKKPKKA